MLQDTEEIFLRLLPSTDENVISSQQRQDMKQELKDSQTIKTIGAQINASANDPAAAVVAAAAAATESQAGLPPPRAGAVVGGKAAVASERPGKRQRTMRSGSRGIAR